MPSSIVFLEEQPEVTFDAHGVRTIYRSGGEVYCRRMSRAYFRRFIETSIRALDEYERGERCEVIQLRR